MAPETGTPPVQLAADDQLPLAALVQTYCAEDWPASRANVAMMASEPDRRMNEADIGVDS